ncbi:hypothetical protein [Hyunsoonleella pacifica]|uniref:Nuclear transport factor 2 family protein n=1 Tax=Hyunsoonleella pacifica TaxID=1080224 RepID=A0A4Q9FPF3_9FLAO|nr:hypothetical protein [Hyunsoonleella pacifica]TBN16706.1 hypothetical protein EYD46_08735 [Hyunsoonleella pacifica]GGD17115.1 hypothetical protein GCM10011368_18880 [Hyunsoonleella pacifica]
MKKSIIKLLLVFLIVFSCEENSKEIDLSNQYYTILNSSNFSAAKNILADSLFTTEINYEKVFSKEEYIELLKWDAVFKPKYRVLKVEKVTNGVVKAKVSQTNMRVLFLNESPIVFNQIIRFKNNKISNIEIKEYVKFNDTIFVRNREKLLSWIKMYHPEIKDFIHDQTEAGALNYLKAINLYNDAH